MFIGNSKDYLFGFKPVFLPKILGISTYAKWKKIPLRKARFTHHGEVRLNIRKLGKTQKKSENWNFEIIWVFWVFGNMFSSIWGEKDNFGTIKLFQFIRGEINEPPKWFVTPWYFFLQGIWNDNCISIWRWNDIFHFWLLYSASH